MFGSASTRSRRPERTDQPALVVGDGQRVDGLGATTDASQPVERLAGGHAGPQARDLRRHEPARRVLRVAEQGRGQPTLVRREPGEQPAGDLGGHLLGESGAVVGIKLLEQLAHVRLAQALEQLLLQGGVEKLEDLQRSILGEQAERHRALLALQPRELLRDLDHIGVAQPSVDQLEVAALEQLIELDGRYRVGRAGQRRACHATEDSPAQDARTPGPHRPGR